MKMIENFLNILSSKAADTVVSATVGGSVGIITMVNRLEDVAYWVGAALIGGALGYVGKTALEHTLKYVIIPFMKKKRDAKNK